MPMNDILTRAYELDTLLHDLQRRSAEAIEAVKQAKYDLRTAQANQVEYTGFRALWDKASGRYAGKAEELAYHVRQAEARLDMLLRQQSGIADELSRLREGRSQLPSREELKQSALESPDTAKEWAALESRFCAGQLLPLLKKNGEALKEYRRLLRGEYPVLSVEEQQKICAEPDLWAQQCVDLLQRLQEALGILEIPFELCPYYRNPIFFLMYAAAKHNRLDRASQAQDQVLQTEKIIREILESLSVQHLSGNLSVK